MPVGNGLVIKLGRDTDCLIINSVKSMLIVSLGSYPMEKFPWDFGYCIIAITGHACDQTTYSLEPQKIILKMPLVREDPWVSRLPTIQEKLSIN
jgi:hypothetical protein